MYSLHAIELDGFFSIQVESHLGDLELNLNCLYLLENLKNWNLNEQN